MIKLSKEQQKQLIFIVVGTLVVVGGLWYGVIGVQADALAQTIKKKSDAESKLSKFQLYVTNAPIIQSNLVTAATRLKSLEDEMPSGDIYSWFVDTLTKFKGSHAVDNVIPKRENLGRFELLPDFPYTNTATWHVTMEAPYNEVGKFLADFENKFPHTFINGLELTLPPIIDPLSPEKLLIDFEVVALVKPSSSP